MYKINFIYTYSRYQLRIKWHILIEFAKYICLFAVYYITLRTSIFPVIEILDIEIFDENSKCQDIRHSKF